MYNVIWRGGITIWSLCKWGNHMASTIIAVWLILKDIVKIFERFEWDILYFPLSPYNKWKTYKDLSNNLFVFFLRLYSPFINSKSTLHLSTENREKSLENRGIQLIKIVILVFVLFWVSFGFVEFQSFVLCLWILLESLRSFLLYATSSF